MPNESRALILYGLKLTYLFIYPVYLFIKGLFYIIYHLVFLIHFNSSPFYLFYLLQSFIYTFFHFVLHTQTLVQYEFLNLLWPIFTQSTPLCISSPHYFIILKNHIQSFHHSSSLHPCDCLRALTTISLKFFITSNSLNERIRPSNDPQWQWLVQKCRTILQNLHWIEFLDSSLLSAAAVAWFWWSFSSSLLYLYPFNYTQQRSQPNYSSHYYFNCPTFCCKE